MKKLTHISASLICALLVSSAAALSANAAENSSINVPNCGNIGNCVVSVNGCNANDLKNILSQCCGSSENVNNIIEQSNSAPCDIQNLINKCGCDISDIQNLIKQCGILPDNSQCTTSDSGSAPTTPSAPTKPSVPDTSESDSKAPSHSTDTSVPSVPDSSGYSVNDYEKQVVQLVNDIRKENGLQELSLNTELSKVARIKAQDMHDNKYFSHNSPTYGSPFDMMKQFGISYRSAGENIAMGQRSPQAVVNAWMNSEGHRANILNSSYTQIGMGYVADGNYWSQMFIG